MRSKSVKIRNYKKESWTIATALSFDQPFRHRRVVRHFSLVLVPKTFLFSLFPVPLFGRGPFFLWNWWTSQERFSTHCCIRPNGCECVDADQRPLVSPNFFLPMVEFFFCVRSFPPRCKIGPKNHQVGAFHGRLSIVPSWLRNIQSDVRFFILPFLFFSFLNGCRVQ